MPLKALECEQPCLYSGIECWLLHFASLCSSIANRMATLTFWTLPLYFLSITLLLTSITYSVHRFSHPRCTDFCQPTLKSQGSWSSFRSMHCCSMSYRWLSEAMVGNTVGADCLFSPRELSSMIWENEVYQSPGNDQQPSHRSL
jgi:hypothetical protein